MLQIHLRLLCKSVCRLIELRLFLYLWIARLVDLRGLNKTKDFYEMVA
jgi:hypothetical protein